MRILIGYDGSDCARLAIQDLSVAGLGDDVEARVVSVADVFPHLTSEFFEDENDAARDRSQLVREAKALARQALAEATTMAAEGAALVKENFSRWQVEQHAIGDSPYWALVKGARRWKSDLAIVGSHGRGAVTRAVLGSVSQLTLSHAPCSVRVGRGRSERTGALRLLVAHDFSSDAKKVIDHIKRRRWPADMIVTLVTILDPQLRTALPALFGEADHANGEALVLACLEQIADELSDVGLRATPLVLRGNPRRLLPREAERLNADCIYLGAKGVGRITEILVGSVATSVASAASCSVEIVR